MKQLASPSTVEANLCSRATHIVDADAHLHAPTATTLPRNNSGFAIVEETEHDVHQRLPLHPREKLTSTEVHREDVRVGNVSFVFLERAGVCVVSVFCVCCERGLSCFFGSVQDNVRVM